MGLDSLFERLVLAQERIATALESRLELKEQPAQPAAEPAKRGRKTKADEPAAAPAVEPTTTVAPAATVAPKQASFLDDEEEASEVDPFDKLDEKAQRAQIRSELIGLQKALDPERALKVLVSAGKCEILSQLKPENFAAVREAIAKAMPKKAA